MTPPATPPSASADPADPARLLLQGRWTLRHTDLIGQALSQAPDQIRSIDATGVERLDTLGVLRLIRFARSHDLDFSGFTFHPDHHALVAAIERELKAGAPAN